MQIGIIGLPNSTKTTIFNALTHSQVETAAYSTGQIETHVAIVTVPDPRVDRLSVLFRPRKTTYARIQYNDIAGLRVGIGRDGGLSGPLLNAVAQNDALLHVVRAFEDEHVPHPNGPVAPASDLAALDFELLFSDLLIVERRMERLEHDLSRKGAYAERQTDQRELDLLAPKTPTVSFILRETTGTGFWVFPKKLFLSSADQRDFGTRNPAPRPALGAGRGKATTRLPVSYRQAHADPAQRGRRGER